MHPIPRSRPWRPTPLCPAGGCQEPPAPPPPPAAAAPADCPGEVDQYGWYPAGTKSPYKTDAQNRQAEGCAGREKGRGGAPAAAAGPGRGGGWTEGYNTANGGAAFYYNHYTRRIAWAGAKTVI